MADMVKLGELIQPWKDMVQVEDPRSVPLISVKLHGQGAVRREIGDGKAPKPFTGNRGRAGQFVFSRIWARRGAMALLPSSLDGVVVTNEFPLFDINQNRLEPKYLLYLVQTRAFLDELERVSAGASGQNRVKESAFLNIAVQLPPLDEQRRIVEILDRVDAIRAKRRRMLADFDELPRSLFMIMFNDVSEHTCLSYYVRGFISGKSLVSEIDSGNKVLKTSAVANNNFDGSQVKYLPAEYVPKTEHKINVGDVLVNRKNTLNLVGSAGYVWKAPDDTYLSDLLWKVDVDGSKCNPIFLWQMLISGTVHSQICNMATGAHSSMVNITKSSMLDLPVKKVPISLQREFARRVEAIAAARAKVERALALDDELFASLQSRAFRGEL